jgi:hypothetical protein
MVEQEKLDKVFEILVERGLVEKSGSFTDEGRDFTRQKSRNAWCIIRSDNCLWVPVVSKRLDEDGSLHYTSWDWRFKSAEEMEPEQFKEFCEYFEIDEFENVIAIDVEDLCL